MKLMPILYLRLAGLAFVGTIFTSACGLSLKDPNAESERDKVQLETWNNGPGGSSYSFVKCSSSHSSDSSMLTNICGTKLGDSTGAANYNWHSNCSGSRCGSVFVFAHYLLPDNLGAQQTMHIEAFDNPQFTHAPVASLEIAGFDATKPASTGREEIFLAPGEYYFRAYLTHEGAAALPYSLQGMELVSDAPVGVLGALSGAQRVLVKEASFAADPVHINIDQLFKKPQPAEDSLAKFRLAITLPLASKVEKFRDVHILLLKEADLELNPSYNFTVSSNSFTMDTLATDFVSPSLTPGAYYVFTYVDANSNGFVDAGELGSFVTVDGKAAAIQIDKEKTKTLATTLAVLAN